MYMKNETYKRLVCFVMIACMLTALSVAPASADTMELNCKSAILMDASTGKIIYEKNSHEKLPPASVTKVMTMLLIMEAIDSGKISFDDKVTISRNADSRSTEGTKLLLDEGEVRTVKELMYGIAVESANDACIAMAEHISGSQEEFVALMNKRAQELGMSDTTFKNANGLPSSGHATSAHDIAVMSRELVKHDKVFEFIGKYTIILHVGKKNDVKRELFNKNKMVRFYNDVDGIKTGWTNEAMYCISLTAKRNNLRLISVILGAPSVPIRNVAARKLIDYGFANYSNIDIVKQGDKVKELKIAKGDTDKLFAVAGENVSVLLLKGEDKNVTKTVNLPASLVAPIEKGQKIGELVLVKDNQEVGRYPLVSDRKVERASFFNNLKKAVQYWIGK